MTSCYCCKVCRYETFRRDNMEKHLVSTKHLNKNRGNFVGIDDTIQYLVERRDEEVKIPIKIDDSSDLKILVLQTINELKIMREDNEIIKKENKELRNDNEELKRIITGLKKENTHIKNSLKRLDSVVASDGGLNINNTTFNDKVNINNINIQVQPKPNPFGKENWTHLPLDEIMTLMKGVNDCVPNILQRIHFSEQKPENNNIKIPNKRLPKIETYNGEIWETKNKRKTLDGLVRDTIDKLECEYGDEFKESATQFIKELWEKNYDILTSEEHPEHRKCMKEVREKVEFMIENNQKRMMVK